MSGAIVTPTNEKYRTGDIVPRNTNNNCNVRGGGTM